MPENLKAEACYEVAMGDVELDEGPVGIIMPYLHKEDHENRSSSCRPGELGAMGHTVQAPLAADVMDAVGQRQAPQLEPRSRYSVFQSHFARSRTPRNPAYPQPL